MQLNNKLSKVKQNFIKLFKMTSTKVDNDSNSEPYFVSEGQAKIKFDKAYGVFYNPVQEFNRDMSIAAIQQYIKSRPNQDDECKILEALSASGLRSIRYAKEIEGVSKIIANDISQSAVENIKRNIQLNEVSNIVETSHDDARLVMIKHQSPKDQFHIIDLDPYGSASQFLDSAIYGIKEGGLLCITCTDLGILCGNSPESCYAKYGAISLKGKSCHEMALRILLQAVESHANRQGRYIKPLLSLSIDFYIRVFLTVHYSPLHVKSSTSKIGHVYQCTGCESMNVQPLGKIIPHENGKNLRYKLPTVPPVQKNCQFCEHPFQMGGPFWIDPIHDLEFVQSMINSLDDSKFKTHDRMMGMLSVISEELPDVPFYYVHDHLCSKVKGFTGKINKFRSAILNGGFRVSFSHANKNSLKTDASNEFIWDMIRCHVSENSNSTDLSRLSKDSVAYHILSKPVKNKINFNNHPDANPLSRALSLKRFQENPEKFWGPKARATAGGTIKQNEKSIRNQGRKRKKHQNEEIIVKQQEKKDKTNND